MTGLCLPMFLIENCSTAYANYQIFYGLNWIFILMIANKQRNITGLSSLGVRGGGAEAEYAHQMILAPPDFQILLRPCKGTVKCIQVPYFLI